MSDDAPVGARAPRTPGPRCSTAGAAGPSPAGWRDVWRKKTNGAPTPPKYYQRALLGERKRGPRSKAEKEAEAARKRQRLEDGMAAASDGVARDGVTSTFSVGTMTEPPLPLPAHWEAIAQAKDDKIAALEKELRIARGGGAAPRESPRDSDGSEQ